MSSSLGKKILLIGGGGHCKSVIDSLLSSEEYDEIGIIDNASETSYQGCSVIGKDDDLPELFQNGWKYAFISVGSVGNTNLRRKLYKMVADIGFAVPVILDPSAAVAKEVFLGEGTFVGKNAVINSCSEIGTCAIVNSGAIVEHDCSIGAFAHVSPGAILCGQVRIGEDSHIGAGSVVRQQIHIGSNVLVGAGSVIVKDIRDGVKVYGNPGKVVE